MNCFLEEKTKRIVCEKKKNSGQALQQATMTSLVMNQLMLTDFDKTEEIVKQLKEKCSIGSDTCKLIPDLLVKACKGLGNAPNVPIKIRSFTDCDTKVNKAVEKYCESNIQASICTSFLTTTTADDPTTEASKLPMFIGLIAGIIFLLAVGACLFFYCRKKKSSAPAEGMTGVTVEGGSKGSSKGSSTGKSTATGTTATGATTVKGTTVKGGATTTCSKY